MNKRVAAVVIFLVIIGGAVLLSRRPKTQQAASTPIPTASPTSTTTVMNYDNWELFRSGYAFPLPPHWKNTSDTGGTATFEPGDAVGNIEKIAVTRLSDEKVIEGQNFTTQAEFDQWYTLDAAGNIQRIKNIVIDGEKAVMLSQQTKEGKWTVITWARHEGINLYFTTYGSGKYNDVDAAAVEYMVTHFTFTAPASTGMEKK